MTFKLTRRILSFCLSVVLLLGCVSFLSAVSAGAADAAAEDLTQTVPFTVTTNGKAKRLTLTWEPYPFADGYQLFRSETGKKGSFKKIASVRGETEYTDKDLQHNSVYYYKLRPFYKTLNGYVFGGFDNVVGATRLTNSFLKKQLIKAQKVARLWMDVSMPRCKNGRVITRTVETDEGLEKRTFCEVTKGSVRSTAALKKYLCRYFSEDFVENYVSVHFCDHDGRLYQMQASADDPGYYIQSETALKEIVKQDTVVTFDAELKTPDFNQTKSVFGQQPGAKKQKINKTTGRIIVDPDGAYWNLTLVNKQRELPKGYTPQLQTIAGFDYSLDKRVTPHFEEMFRAARKDGVWLEPVSTYRSYSYQNTLFQNFAHDLRRSYGYSASYAETITATRILYPGTSEHQLGLAADIGSVERTFANSKAYRWLTQHAHEYGFILRYTEEKQPITGIIPEPWHWRYVGVEWAKEIRDSGLCLEEYLALKGGLFLSERKSLTLILEDGKWVFDQVDMEEPYWHYGNFAYRKDASVGV